MIMNFMLRLFCSCCLFLVVSIMQAAIYPDPVEGVVTCKGKGLAGVVVTDGFDVVLTDAQGVMSCRATGMLGLYIFPRLQVICRKRVVGISLSFSRLRKAV